MLSAFFDKITRTSLRLNWLTIALALLLIGVGVLAAGDLNQEMVPRIEFPQTIVIAQWPDAADAEDFLDQVTIPMEEAISEIEGVVNVESTTNNGFAFMVIRNEFGLNQDRIVTSVEEALAEASLPESMEAPQILNFSLSDLPIVTASVSSSSLTLAELKQVVQDELIPELEELDQVSQVTVGGGQELPEETEPVEVAAVEAAELEPTPEPTSVPEPTPAPTADPAALPADLVAAFAQGGQDVSTVADITPDLMRQVTSFGPLADQLLALFTPDNLRLLDPEVIALLPTSYVATLDDDLHVELDELAADFGGAGAQFAAEMAAAEAEEEPAQEPEEVVTELPTVAAQPLPESWIAAAAAANQTLATTADLDATVAAGIVDFAPQLVADLEPVHWRALSPEVVAILLPVVEEPDPLLVTQLTAIGNAAAGIEPEPLPLPQEMIDGAAAAGQTLETTADITVESIELLSQFAPEMLAAIPAELLYALTPAKLAALARRLRRLPGRRSAADDSQYPHLGCALPGFAGWGAGRG